MFGFYGDEFYIVNCIECDWLLVLYMNILFLFVRNMCNEIVDK